MQGGHHRGHAEARLEAQRHVDADADKGEDDGPDGVGAELAADGTADGLAGEHQLLDGSRAVLKDLGVLGLDGADDGRDVREISLGLVLGELGLDAEGRFASADRGLDADGGVRQADGGRQRGDLAGVDVGARSDGHEGGFAAAEVLAEGFLALVGELGDAEGDDGPRDDERHPGELQERDVERRLEDREAEDAGHDATRQGEFLEATAGHEGREERGEDTDDQRDAEATDRTRAHEGEDQGHEQVRQVGVDDGPGRAVVAFAEGDGAVLAGTGFFAHAFEDQDVRVDGHAEREHERGDAGKRDGRAEVGHGAEHHEEVEHHAGDGDEAAPDVEPDHEEDDETDGDERGRDGLTLRILGEGRADGSHVLRDQRELQRIVQHVGKVDDLFAAEVAGDGRAGATDGFTHGRSGLELAVEDDGELTDGAGVAFRDLGGEVAELLGAFVRELHVHVEGDAVIGAAGGGLDDLAGGIGGLLHEVAVHADFAGAAVDVAEREDLVGRNRGGGAEHRVDGERTERVLAVGLARALGAVHLAELELGRLLERVHDVRIVGGVFARQLDLEGEIADGAKDRLGDAELVDALFHDLEGLVDHLGVGDVGLVTRALLAGFDTGRIDLEREGHPTLQVETELETALGGDHQLLEHDAVALSLVRLADDLGFGEEERTEVDRGGATTAFADVTQSLEVGDRLLVGRDGGVLVMLHTLEGFGVELVEFGLLRDDLRGHELVERDRSDRVELEPGDSQGDERNRDLPEPGPGCHCVRVGKG